MTGRPSRHARPLPRALRPRSSAVGAAGSGPGSATDLRVGAAGRRGAVAVAGWGGSDPGTLRPLLGLCNGVAQPDTSAGRFPTPWTPASRRLREDTYYICSNVFLLFLPRPAKDRPGRHLGPPAPLCLRELTTERRRLEEEEAKKAAQSGAGEGTCTLSPSAGGHDRVPGGCLSCPLYWMKSRWQTWTLVGDEEKQNSLYTKIGSKRTKGTEGRARGQAEHIGAGVKAPVRNMLQRGETVEEGDSPHCRCFLIPDVGTRAAKPGSSLLQ
ncbi:PREDICTED: uncharacterized protein LOC106148115 [Chinchilla lanigera]|uniref:uncharacterized protein LOC106148115 n=1 Tax=Chinchilla lanigera TaxID=34839 RepID=UPI000697324A|nr:PREDICTED: uncharacterized protein LOC106148115 [Chinchilla lanigera]